MKVTKNYTPAERRQHGRESGECIANKYRNEGLVAEQAYAKYIKLGSAGHPESFRAGFMEAYDQTMAIGRTGRR